jgi:putative heme-binding domain-containing protein
MELKYASALATALAAAATRTRKAALIALDQMDGSPLQQAQVAPLLAHADAELRRAAVWVISHHAAWGGAVLDFLNARLRAPQLDANESEAVRETLLAFAANAQVQQLVAATLSSAALPAERQLFLLDTLERCALKQFPAGWLNGFANLLKTADARVRARMLVLLRARQVAALDADLHQLALNAAEPADLRLAALGCLAAREPRLAEPTVEFLLSLLPPDREPTLRLAAAQTLGQAELSRERLLSLAQRHLPQADSITLLPLLEAFRKSTDEAIGQALLATLRQPDFNLDLISGKRLEQLFQPFSNQVRADAQPLLARFANEEAARVQRLRELEPLLTAGGDAGNGRRVFFGQKAACGSCHTIGLEGGHVGPDLTTIGAIRSGHDILEAIIFPNATLVPGHESRQLTTKTSREPFTGIINELESDRAAVVLVSGPKEKLRIPRDEIVSINLSQVSLMPEGFATQLSQKELTDLLAFLRAQK